MFCPVSADSVWIFACTSVAICWSVRTGCELLQPAANPRTRASTTAPARHECSHSMISLFISKCVLRLLLIQRFAQLAELRALVPLDALNAFWNQLFLSQRSPKKLPCDTRPLSSGEF